MYCFILLPNFVSCFHLVAVMRRCALCLKLVVFEYGFTDTSSNWTCQDLWGLPKCTWVCFTSIFPTPFAMLPLFMISPQFVPHNWLVICLPMKLRRWCPGSKKAHNTTCPTTFSVHYLLHLNPFKRDVAWLIYRHNLQLDLCQDQWGFPKSGGVCCSSVVHIHLPHSPSIPYPMLHNLPCHLPFPLPHGAMPHGLTTILFLIACLSYLSHKWRQEDGALAPRKLTTPHVLLHPLFTISPNHS